MKSRPIRFIDQFKFAQAGQSFTYQYTVVGDETDGAVTVRGYHGGELGAGPIEQYVRAVQGVADITWGLPGYTSSQFEKTMIALRLSNTPPIPMAKSTALRTSARSTR